uniref:Uncharacterized protein n=1 Tax=Glycine max TaxID=3847 RepID=C6TF60_SOYBN|nr:unknown [Glycine max]
MDQSFLVMLSNLLHLLLESWIVRNRFITLGKT